MSHGQIMSLGAPGRYIQGPGVLQHLGEVLHPLAQRFFGFGDELVLSLAGGQIRDSLAGSGRSTTLELFGGECCDAEINRMAAAVEQSRSQFIIGVGGGKAADTAKALNIETGLPIAIVATSASTDAPTSHLAVIYSDQHVKQEVRAMKQSPQYVLVDTDIIAQAPVRTLVAGMGDALATRFEAEACWQSQANNLFGNRPTRAALELARLSYSLLRQHGPAARQANSEQRVTPDLESVVEANILLSGLGFESGGLAAAHACFAGFTLLKELDRSLHGELVSFGVLVQMVLEERPQEFIEDLLTFYAHIGLPLGLGQLGLGKVSAEVLQPVAQKVCEPGSYMHNMPFAVSPAMVCEAILKADDLAQQHPGA